jgi:hypothetical protein
MLNMPSNENLAKVTFLTDKNERIISKKYYGRGDQN